MPFTIETLLQTRELWTYLTQTKKPIVIYGMGDGAQKIIDVCQQKQIPLAGLFVSDDHVRDKVFMGFRLQSLSQIEAQFDEFIILLAFAAFQPNLLDLVYRLAARHEVLVPDVPLFGQGLFDKAYVLEHQTQILQAYHMLADEQSRRVYENVLRFKLSGDFSYLTACETPRQEAMELLKLHTRECYVDLGAYDGDTIVELLDYTDGGYQEIYALEPDRKNFKKLARYIETAQLRATIMQAGAWETQGTLSFYDKSSRSSALGEGGNVQVAVTSVDVLLDGAPATLIKYDVEGAERAALKGSMQTIARCAPRLVIAAYHRNEDLFDLILYIKSLRAQYRVYLRHHPYIPAWETNLYIC